MVLGYGLWLGTAFRRRLDYEDESLVLHELRVRLMVMEVKGKGDETHRRRRGASCIVYCYPPNTFS